MMFWLALLLLHFLTVLWYVLIRRDALGYMHTQLKVVGEHNGHHLDHSRFRFLLSLYAVVLMLLMGAATLYFYAYA